MGGGAADLMACDLFEGFEEIFPNGTQYSELEG